MPFGSINRFLTRGLIVDADGKPVNEQRQRVVNGVCRNRRGQISAHEIKNAEDKPQNRRRAHPLHALRVVPRAENQTPDNEADARASEMTAKAVKNEGALQFLLDSTRRD